MIDTECQLRNCKGCPIIRVECRTIFNMLLTCNKLRLTITFYPVSLYKLKPKTLRKKLDDYRKPNSKQVER